MGSCTYRVGWDPNIHSIRIIYKPRSKSLSIVSIAKCVCMWGSDPNIHNTGLRR